MAQVIPSFLSSAKLAIHIGGKRIAYAQSLSISDRMNVAPVGGVGSYNADALEPTQYSVNGSFVITIYDDAAWKALEAIDSSKGNIPNRATGYTKPKDASGNSMFSQNFFSPLHLIISRTFDITIFERNGMGEADYLTTPTYKIENCRLNAYSLAFTPGSLLQENVGFIGMKMTDIMSSVITSNSTEAPTTAV